MSVNNNFYATINKLASYGLQGGTIPEIVDYASFVDVGKTIADIGGENLANNFMANLANTLALIVDTHRSYKGKYTDIYRGTINYGNTIQMIMDGFYETQAAVFAALPSDGESVDQYPINRPTTHVRYYTNTNTYSIPVTVTRDQLRKAWHSPDEMDAFIRNNVVGALLNSNEYHREIGRINAVNSQIAMAIGSASPTNVVNLHKLLGDLDPENPLYSKEVVTPADLENQFNRNLATNPEAIRFIVSTIRHYSRAIESPSNLYNTEGVTTFTPASGKRLYLLDRFAKAADALIYQNAFNPDYNKLEDYVTVDYWQNVDADMRVSAESIYTPSVHHFSNVIGVLFDEYAVGEYLRSQTLDSTPYNARGKYWNYWLNVETELINNPFANTVVFTWDETN